VCSDQSVPYCHTVCPLVPSHTLKHEVRLCWHYKLDPIMLALYASACGSSKTAVVVILLSPIWMQMRQSCRKQSGSNCSHAILIRWGHRRRVLVMLLRASPQRSLCSATHVAVHAMMLNCALPLLLPALLCVLGRAMAQATPQTGNLKATVHPQAILSIRTILGSCCLLREIILIPQHSFPTPVSLSAPSICTVHERLQIAWSIRGGKTKVVFNLAFQLKESSLGVACSPVGFAILMPSWGVRCAAAKTQ
jgi:hypothetical protein